MKYLRHICILMVLPWIGQACDETSVNADGEKGGLVEVGYASLEAPRGRAQSDDWTPFSDGTVFRFLGYVASSANKNNPSLTDHIDDVPQFASPYGYYQYTSSKGEMTFEPCDIDENSLAYIGRNPAGGQRLTALKEDVAYEILAYTPPRPTRVPEGLTIIPYNRGEDLFLSKSPFEIVIPSQVGKVYQVYQVPSPWLFINMKAVLKLAFYEREVPFTIEPSITLSGLGTFAYLHPYSWDMKLFYHNEVPGESESDKETKDDHLEDLFTLTTVDPVEGGTGGTLRYTVEDIPIFPADYSSTLIKHPIEVVINIKYGTQTEAEPTRIKLPINAQPAHNYIISFVVSRTSVEVRAHAVSGWGEGLPADPMDIGASGGILLGIYNNSNWGDVTLPGEDL